MYKIILLALFFLQPWYFGGVFRAEIMVVFFAFFMVFIKSEKFIPWRNITFVFIVMFIVLCISFFSGEFDVSLFRKYVSLFVLVFGSVLIVKVFNIKKSDLLTTCKAIVLFSLTFYLLAVFFPVIRDFSLALKGETYGIEDRLEVYRLWFPTSAHTFHLGLFFFIITIFLMLEKQKSIWVVISLVCASIAARSAMLASIVAILFYIVTEERKYIVAFLFLIPLFVFSVFYLSENSIAVKYALEPLMQLIETGSFESKSSDTLLEKHLYIPTEKQIILGDGRYIDESTGAFYGHTDSGMIRPLLYGGILFQIIYLLLCFFFFRCFVTYGLFGWFIIFMLFVMNVKAELITSTPYLALIVVLSEVLRNESYNKKYISCP